MIISVEQRKLRESQETERELDEKCNMANAEKLRHQFRKDMEVLRARVPDQVQAAKEAALDKKYLADRQKMHGMISKLLKC